MKSRIFLMTDPNSGYTQEDFNKEFGSPSSKLSDFTDFKMDLKTCNKSDNEYPDYATTGSSGFDLRANLETAIPMLPASRHIIPTGLYFELPQNYEIQVRPRSGLAAKHGITVLNTPGTVDEDYRGEIKVILIN